MGEQTRISATKLSLALMTSCGLFCAGAVQSAAVSGQGTWETTLQGRDASGNSVPLLAGGVPNPALAYVYDTQLDLTWLANWNVNGPTTWAAATAWATSLTDFGGGWSLPGVEDTGMAGCYWAYSGADCGYNVYGSEVARRVSPLAHMFYDTLGNKAGWDEAAVSQSGGGLTNTGPFSNMLANDYWSGTAYAPDPNYAWYFFTLYGGQSIRAQDTNYFAVAVRPGDVFVNAVAEPGSLVALLAGLGAFAAMRGRRER